MNGASSLEGALPATQRIHFSIVLPLRRQQELRDLLARLYDPASPDYRHFLTVQQFTDQFGPTEQDYNAVLQFASASGFTIAAQSSNRLVISLSGTSAQVERAFHVRMNSYRRRAENRLFYAPDREPAIPAGIRIQHIAGLNNASLPRPMARKPSAAPARAASVKGSGPEASYLASDLRAAYYGGSTLTGKGQTVALVQFDGYRREDVDLTFSTAGQSSNVPIKNVLLDGVDGSPVHGDDGEQVLDIVQAIGMAPGLAEVRVYIGNVDADILNAIAVENLAKQVSISWTWNPDDPDTDDIFFQEMAAQGQSVFAASGDFGEYDPFVNFFYPAEDAYVTSVGGTTLTTERPGGPWASEVAWSRSGGGVSPDSTPIPAWQIGIANSSNNASTTLRNVPDVAMEADFDNYNCDMGKCSGAWAGTSFAAPRWAAFAALMNEQAANQGMPPIGFLNPLLYRIGASPEYTNTFHDVTIGNNDLYFIAPRPFYYAVPGYDLVTGWGSPIGQSLIDLFLPSSAPQLQISVSPAHVSINPGESATVAIKPSAGTEKSGGVQLEVSGLPDGVSASFDKNPTSGEAKLTLFASESALRGSYLLTIRGKSGDIAASTSLEVSVDAPGFTLTPAQGSVKIYQGSAGSTAISVSKLAGFYSPVNFALTSPLPTGVTAYLTPNSDRSSCVLTLDASTTATLGSVVLTIAGTSGVAKAVAHVALSVSPPSFVLSVSPIPFVLSRGSTTTSTATVVPWGSFKEKVELTGPQLPAGVSTSFAPISTATTSQITWSVSDSAPEGSANVAIAGASNTAFSSSQFQQEVFARPVPTFNVGVSPGYLNLGQGASGSATVAVSEINGFAGEIELSATQLPPGISVSFDPRFTNSASTVTVSTAADAQAGIFVISVWAETPDHTRSTLSPLFLNIAAAPPFSVSANSGPLVLAQHSSASSALSLWRASGFTDAVSFSVSSALPAGVDASFALNQVTGNGSLTIGAADSAAPGNYSLNVTGTAGSHAAVMTLPFTIQEARITARPVFSVPGGTYSSAQTVSISDSTSNAKIYYTVDGTVPTASSTIYSKPITVSASATLQAIAIAPGFMPSSIATTAYDINIPLNPVPAIRSISPPFAAADGPSFSLTVTGSNFTAASVVQWGGVALATTFVADNQLTATVPANQISSVRTFTVNVVTPGPGGGNSNPLQFQVNSAVGSGASAPRFTPATISLSAGTTGDLKVALPGEMNGVSAGCLNLPTGATCAYSAGLLHIATSASSPSGTYQITAVFSGSTSASTGLGWALPFFLVPVKREKRGSRGVQWIFCTLFLILITALTLAGCGGSSAPTSTPTNPSPPQSVTTSGVVSLTIN